MKNVLSSTIVNWKTMPREITLEIAKRLRHIRRTEKISQAALAESSGVSLGSIKRFERTGDISLLSLAKIAYALDRETEMESLFSRKTYRSIDEVLADNEDI